MQIASTFCKTGTQTDDTADNSCDDIKRPKSKYNLNAYIRNLFIKYLL